MKALTMILIPVAVLVAIALTVVFADIGVVPGDTSPLTIEWFDGKCKISIPNWTNFNLPPIMDREFGFRSDGVVMWRERWRTSDR